MDDEDFLGLVLHKWCYSTAGYAIRKGPNNTTIYMHKVILRSAYEVDHKNGDKLDNRKSNLRIATHFQNSKNRNKQLSASSKFKGVDFQKRNGKWRARIKLDYKSKYLGEFDTEIDAAKAYNSAATVYFGSFAKLNEV